MLKEELHIMDEEHHGIQNCNTFQEPFHCKETTFKRLPRLEYQRSYNCSLANKLWTPDPTMLPPQDVSTENLLQ